MTKYDPTNPWQTPRLSSHYPTKLDNFLALFPKLPESDETCDALKCKLDGRIQTEPVRNRTSWGIA
ncbi:MAG: hypothetical protein RIE73_08555 [Coleofasciculus sp. C1-SOL-03]